MERHRDRSTAHGQRTYGLDPNDRHRTRSGPHQVPRSGPGMTRRRMTETDEENMYDVFEDFENLFLDPRHHSSRGGPQYRRDPHHLDNMGSFDQEDLDSRRPLTRGGRQGGRDTGRHHLDETDFFDDIRGPSTRGEPQRERGPRPAYMDQHASDRDLHGPEGRRGSRPQTVDRNSELSIIDARLAIVDEEIERVDRSLEYIEQLRRGPHRDPRDLAPGSGGDHSRHARNAPGYFR